MNPNCRVTYYILCFSHRQQLGQEQGKWTPKQRHTHSASQEELLRIGQFSMLPASAWMPGGNHPAHQRKQGGARGGRDRLWENYTGASFWQRDGPYSVWLLLCFVDMYGYFIYYWYYLCHQNIFDGSIDLKKAQYLYWVYICIQLHFDFHLLKFYKISWPSLSAVLSTPPKTVFFYFPVFISCYGKCVKTTRILHSNKRKVNLHKNNTAMWFVL